MMKPTTFMGQDFLSQGDAADAYGITSSTMSRYARAGKLHELENKIRVRKQLQLPHLSAAPSEGRLISFSLDYHRRLRGIASIPEHVSTEDFADWFKKNGDPSKLTLSGEQWNWGDFNDCMIIAADDAPDDVITFTEEHFPRPKAIPDVPVGRTHFLSVQTVTLVMHQQWPIPDVDLQLGVSADEDANRWVLIDGVYRLVDDDNRVIFQNWGNQNAQQSVA